MELNLNREWYENRLASEDGMDITAGTYGDAAEKTEPTLPLAGHSEEEFAESVAFSVLIRLSRRERGLTVQQLAQEAGVSVAELISIERDHRYRPKTQTVMQLSKFFGIARESLMKLATATHAHDESFVNETIRFAANAADFVNVGEQERQVLHEYVDFLCKQSAG